jgi:DNA-binding MarR family transcriptional regulator
VSALDFTPDLSGLDRLLENRVRLAVAVLLSRYDRMSFTRLRDLTGETDGNIGAHLRRLEDGGYVRVDKTFRDRKPLTRYSLTDAGREALRRHLHVLDSLVRGADLPPVQSPSDTESEADEDA